MPLRILHTNVTSDIKTLVWSSVAQWQSVRFEIEGLQV